VTGGDPRLGTAEPAGALHPSDALGAAFGARISVKSYGAKGDGSTDDRLTIQAALDTTQPGVVFLPDAGIYAVGITSLGLCLTARADVRLDLGRGTLKIKSGSGQWFSLIEGSNTDGFEIIGGTIDANYAGNPLVSTSTLGARPRYLGHFGQSDDVTIRGVTVRNHTGVNTFYSSGTGQRTFTVDCCRFLGMGNAPADADMTARRSTPRP
jgi:polygalacturonase